MKIQGDPAVEQICWEQAEHNHLTSRIYQMMMKWARYANSTYKNWSVRPRSGHFFSGAYWNGKETSSALAAFAVVSTCGVYDSKITGISREDMKERAIRALRYMCFTHDTGPQDCVRPDGDIPQCRGKKWGGEDSDTRPAYFREMCSGKAIGDFALAAWLLWGEVDGETQKMVYKVVSHYANKFSNMEPRSGVYLDTQCEENGWVACGIATAVTMFPNDPNHTKWRQALERYTRATVSVPQGQRKNKRIGPVTFHPDYTAENHRFVHPTYMQLGIILKSKHLVLQTMLGQKPDDFALEHNRELLEKVIAVWSQGDGLTIPVQGQSWFYNSHHNLIFVHGVLRLFSKLEESALLQENLLDVAEKLQNSNSQGCFLEENGENIVVVPNAHQTVSHMEYDIISNLVDTYLLHLFGGIGAAPLSRDSLNERYKGVHTYRSGGIVVNRTSRSLSGFSWRNHVMAYCLPESGLWITTPLFNSFVGNVWMPEDEIVLDEEQSIIETVEDTLMTYEDGFAASAKLQRNHQLNLHQHIAFISLPDGRAIYAEQFTGKPGTKLQAIHTGTVGVRNENYKELKKVASGRRTLSWLDEAGVANKDFEGFLHGEENQTLEIPSTPMVNIDEQIGYILLNSKGVCYYNRHHYRKWRGLEDVLILNCSKESTIYSQGQGEHFAMIVLPNRTFKETQDELISTSSVFEKDYVMIETGNWMVYSNYSKQQSVQLTRKITDHWLLYEGAQSLIAGKSTWYGTLPEKRSGYVQAILKLESSSWFSISVEAFITGDRFVIYNRSEQDVSMNCTNLTTGTERSVCIHGGSRFEEVLDRRISLKKDEQI